VSHGQHSTGVARLARKGALECEHFEWEPAFNARCGPGGGRAKPRQSRRSGTIRFEPSPKCYPIPGPSTSGSNWRRDSRC